MANGLKRQPWPGAEIMWKLTGPVAETEGFEPSIHLTAYDDLANRCLQPLGHVSGEGAFAAI